MTLIPEQNAMTPEQAFENLQKWWQSQQQLIALKAAEILARKDLVKFYFANPREGTNRLDLGGGFDLKLDFGYDRKVDEAALDAAKASEFKKLGLSKDDLFVYKPALNLKAYRKLNAVQRAFIDELMDVKETTPQLHIVQRAQDDNGIGEAAAEGETTAKPARAPRKAAAAKAPKAPAKAAAAKKAPAKRATKR